MCEQKHYLVWFPAGAKAVRYRCPGMVAMVIVIIVIIIIIIINLIQVSDTLTI